MRLLSFAIAKFSQVKKKQIGHFHVVTIVFVKTISQSCFTELPSCVREILEEQKWLAKKEEWFYSGCYHLLHMTSAKNIQTENKRTKVLAQVTKLCCLLYFLYCERLKMV